MTEKRKKADKTLAKLYVWLLVIGSKLNDFEKYLSESYYDELEIIKKINLLSLGVRYWLDKLQKFAPELDLVDFESIKLIKKGQFDFKKLHFKKNHSEFNFKMFFDPFIRFEEELIVLKTDLNRLEIDSVLMKDIEEIILLANELIEIIEDFI